MGGAASADGATGRGRRFWTSARSRRRRVARRGPALPEPRVFRTGRPPLRDRSRLLSLQVAAVGADQFVGLQPSNPVDHPGRRCPLPEWRNPCPPGEPAFDAFRGQDPHFGFGCCSRRGAGGRLLDRHPRAALLTTGLVLRGRVYRHQRAAPCAATPSHRLLAGRGAFPVEYPTTRLDSGFRVDRCVGVRVRRRWTCIPVDRSALHGPAERTCERD